MKKKNLLSITIVLSLSTIFLHANRQENLDKQKDIIGNKRVKTIALEIKGNKALNSDEIYEVLGVKVVPWYVLWEEHTKKIPIKLIDLIPDTLRGFLDSKGYYDAEFKIKKSSKKITIIIKENRPLRVKDINISSDFPIKKYITFSRGDSFETERFINIKSRIKSELLHKGYCSYDLDTKAYVNLKSRSVNLVYRLKKGGLCHFGKTTIVKKPKGLRDGVILSRLRYREGDLYTTERVNESYRALNELGMFGRVVIDTQKKYFNRVQPEIYTQAKDKLHRYSVALGYDSIVGFRVKANYNQFNFLGDGRKIGLTAQYSSVVKEIYGNFYQPALFKFAGRYINFQLRTGYRKEHFDDYDEKKLFSDWKLNYIDGFWKVDLGLTFERINIALKNPSNTIFPGDFNLAYNYINVSYDHRDSKINPKNGYYLSSYFEYGYSQGKLKSNPYYKLVLEGRLIHSFGDLTLAGVIHTGILEDGGIASLPASKFFYAGGSFSNRAYKEHDIGVTLSPTQDLGIGGKNWLNLSFEADYPILENLDGAIFLDATKISEKRSGKDSKWIESAGFGLRYQTPIGPLKIDFAFNIHQFSQHRLTFMIGQSF